MAVFIYLLHSTKSDINQLKELVDGTLALQIFRIVLTTEGTTYGTFKCIYDLLDVTMLISQVI